MMTSKSPLLKTSDKEAFVWIRLPEATEPVVAGKLESDDQGNVQFNYGKSYLDRIYANPPAISIYEPELPLKNSVLPLLDGLTMPGCTRDSAPDAWGRRVIINKKLGRKGKDTDTDALGELTYLLGHPERLIRHPHWRMSHPFGAAYRPSKTQCVLSN